jgi:hypothetical protein
MATPDLDAEDEAAVAALYGGRLGDFVAGRDQLARELRSAGRRDEAALVKGLRKPSVVAWALDAGRQSDPATVDGLVAAVDRLNAAQEGGGGGDLRTALTALREAQAAVVEAAVAATEAHDQPVDRAQVAPALLAVVADPGALSDLQAGRLVAVPEAGGLGVSLAGGAPAQPGRAPAPRRKAPARKAKPAAATAKGKATSAAADMPAAPRRRTAGAADRVVARAEAAADEARRVESEAAAMAKEAEEAARAADREATAARRRADTARRAADLARQKADAATARRRHTEERLAAARNR